MLSENIRNALIDFLADELFHSMFGDGMEDEYIRDGVNFKGVNNMTDQELVDNCNNYTSAQDFPELAEAEAQLAVHKTLAE